jgi:hypothetical protein
MSSEILIFMLTWAFSSARLQAAAAITGIKKIRLSPTIPTS